MNAVRAAFAGQSRGCAKLGSPFMARLMALCADRLAPGGAVSDKVLGWTGDPTGGADSLPLRLTGALHALKRAGQPDLLAVYPPHTADDDALWGAVTTAMKTEAAFILPLLDKPPQTNEVRRSAALIPALHLLARRFGLPIDLVEIGASAGLNLRADLFHLTAGDTSFGPRGASVRLEPDWSGTPPAPAHLRVAGRTGIDIAPLDPEADGARLLSYLWPDQPDRIARTEAAIAVARAEPAHMIAADAVDWLRRSLAPTPGRLTLIFHTIAWQYLPEAARMAGDALIAKAGAATPPEAPLARFAMEAAGPHADLTLQHWPEGVMVPIGRADYHGRWVDWTCTTLGKDERDGS